MAINNRFRTTSIELKCLGTRTKVFNPSGLNMAAVCLRPTVIALNLFQGTKLKPLHSVSVPIRSFPFSSSQGLRSAVYFANITPKLSFTFNDPPLVREVRVLTPVTQRKKHNA